MKLHQILNVSYEDREVLLNLLDHKTKVRYGLYCANSVAHLMTDKRSLEALRITELWLEGKVSDKEMQEAATNATNASYAASASASAASYAAAYAATAAAAYASSASAYAATAAYAASASAYGIKETQLSYLKRLVLAHLFADSNIEVLISLI